MLRGKKMRVTTFRDLTEQRRAEQDIRETNYWLRESQRNSHIGSYVYDIANDHWKSSEELNAIFGIPSDYDKSFHRLEQFNTSGAPSGSNGSFI